jgi:hypothetical protein
MAEGPIPWGAIEQWCGSLQLNEEEREDMHYLVRQLDNCYLQFRASKRPKK